MQLVNISTIWIAGLPLEVGRTRGSLLRLEAVMSQLGERSEAELKAFVRLKNLEQRLFDRMCRLQETRGRSADELCRRTRLLAEAAKMTGPAARSIAFNSSRKYSGSDRAPGPERAHQVKDLQPLVDANGQIPWAAYMAKFGGGQ